MFICGIILHLVLALNTWLDQLHICQILSYIAINCWQTTFNSFTHLITKYKFILKFFNIYSLKTKNTCIYLGAIMLWYCENIVGLCGGYSLSYKCCKESYKYNQDRANQIRSGAVQCVIPGLCQRVTLRKSEIKRLGGNLAH